MYDRNYLDFQSSFLILTRFATSVVKQFYPAKMEFSIFYYGFTKKTFRSRWRTMIDMNDRWPWMMNPRHQHITCVQQ